MHSSEVPEMASTDGSGTAEIHLGDSLPRV